MSSLFVASADDVIDQIMIQCWVFEARSGDYAGARARAERTLERLLAGGLPSRTSSNGLLLDPYGANNMIKSRVGEPADEAWADWQRTTRRNAVSLPKGPHLYRFFLRREWHSYTASSERPVVLRLPLPLRQSQQGPAAVRLLEPAGSLLEIREAPGRVELRLDSAATRGPIAAELEVQFVSGDVLDPMTSSTPLGALVEPDDQLWLREREGLITPSPGVGVLAAELAKASASAREFAHAAWEWLMTNLRFGDVHRAQLDQLDPLGGLLRTRLADCVLGSSLLAALCRAAGIPARLASGYLLHPAGNPGDPVWGGFFRGRIDARFLAEVAPREFTGWGSAVPPERWFRLERLQGNRIQHTLHAVSDGALVRRDLLDLQILGPVGSP